MAADSKTLADTINKILALSEIKGKAEAQDPSGDKNDIVLEIPDTNPTDPKNIVPFLEIFGVTPTIVDRGGVAYREYKFVSANVAKKFNKKLADLAPAQDVGAKAKEADPNEDAEPIPDGKGKADAKEAETKHDKPADASYEYPNSLNEAALLAGIQEVFDKKNYDLVGATYHSDIFESAIRSGAKIDLKELNSKDLEFEIFLAADGFMPSVKDQIKVEFKKAKEKGQEVEFAQKFQDHLSAAVTTSKPQFEAYNAKAVADKAAVVAATAAAKKALDATCDSLNALLRTDKTPADKILASVETSEKYGANTGIYIFADTVDNDSFKALKKTLEEKHIAIDKAVKHDPEEGRSCVVIKDSADLEALRDPSFAADFKTNLQQLQAANKPNEPTPELKTDKPATEPERADDYIELRSPGETPKPKATAKEMPLETPAASTAEGGEAQAEAQHLAAEAEAKRLEEAKLKADTDAAEAKRLEEAKLKADADAAEAKKKTPPTTPHAKTDEPAEEMAPHEPADADEEEDEEEENLSFGAKAFKGIQQSFTKARATFGGSGKKVTFLTPEKDDSEVLAENKANLTIKQAFDDFEKAIEAHQTEYGNDLEYKLSPLKKNSDSFTVTKGDEVLATVKKHANKSISYEFPKNKELGFEMADVVLRAASKQQVLVLHSTNIEHIEQILKAASTPPNNDNIRIKLDAKTEKFLKNYPDKSKLNYFTQARLKEDSLTGKQTAPTAEILEEAEEDVKEAQEAAKKMATDHSAAQATLAKAVKAVADASKPSPPGADPAVAAQAKVDAEAAKTAAEAGVTAALLKKTEAEKALQKALEKQKTVKKGAADAQEGAGLKAIEAAKKEAAQFKADVSARPKRAKPPTA